MATQTKHNVMIFPAKPEISSYDAFLIKYGAKNMTTPAKVETTSPIEWNRSVLGLTATIIAILGVLVGFIWNYAVLSTKFDLLQKEMERQSSFSDRERERLGSRITNLEENDRKRQSESDTIKGYKIGKLEKGDK